MDLAVVQILSFSFIKFWHIVWKIFRIWFTFGIYFNYFSIGKWLIRLNDWIGIWFIVQAVFIMHVDFWASSFYGSVTTFFIELNCLWFQRTYFSVSNHCLLHFYLYRVFNSVGILMSKVISKVLQKYFNHNYKSLNKISFLLNNLLNDL